MDYTKKIKQYSLADLVYHPAGYLLLCLIVIILSAAISFWGPDAGFTALALIIGIPFVAGIIAFPKFGIMVLLISAYLVMWVNRMLINYPMGTLMDVLQVLLVLGFFIKHKYDRNWAFAQNPITLFIILWIGYNVLEVANPVAESKMAWVFTIRTVAMVMLTYFLFGYHIKSIGFVRLIIKTWIALSAFAALYAIFQEVHGFLPFEERWLATDNSNSYLYFIAGRWRRFGIFSEPVASAYNMAISSILCITLLFVTKSFIKKIVLIMLCAVFVAAMLYAGIRGAFILLPASMALLFILKLTPKTFVVGIIGFVMFVALIKVPTSNTVLYRFQTAFSPSYDASFNVRKNNQKRIQPYIQSHPFGGGLGATGTWGQRFSPGSYLASFPPDSGFVRVAVETGWVGLILLCALLFVVLRTGISNYFRIRNNELKHYCLAMVLIIFSLSIGNYPQEALVQFPINIYFCLAMALIGVTLRLDQALINESSVRTNAL